jgi:protein TonB
LEPPRRLEGGISLLAAGVALTALAFVFTLFTFPGILGNSPPPAQVIASPATPDNLQPTTRQTKSRTLPKQFHAPPANISQTSRPVIAVRKPSLPEPPAAIQVDHLFEQSTDALAIIEQTKVQNEKRLEEVRQEEERRREQERLARIEREEQQAREAEETRRLAARRQTLAAAREQEQKERQRQAALASKVAAAPRVTRRTQPHYPVSARKAGAEGTTQIAATINSSGQVNSARINQSSGHSTLDSSALAAVRKWRFEPAKNALGQPIAHQLVIPVTFRIQ